MPKKFLIFTVMVFSTIIFISTFIYANELESIQTAIQSSGAQWIARETELSRLSPNERGMRLGALKPAFVEYEKVLSFQQEQIEGLPDRLDWRDNGGNFVTPVRNQGGCGSCWAFAATAGLEATTLIADRTPGVDLNLAEQILVSCSPAGDCGGGYPTGAAQYIRDTGLPLESCYPYTATNGNCSSACQNRTVDAYKIKNYHYVGSYIPTVSEIKAALNQYGPLPTTLDVYQDFFSYGSGIYEYSYGSLAGGHAVLIVGYDDPGQYFIVKNSWGTGWGESGYFRIAYSQMDNKVEFGAWTLAYETLSSLLYTLTAIKDGDGAGIISAENLTCKNGVCSGDYRKDTTVNLTAEPSLGYVFGGWTGCDTVNANICTINMSSDLTVTATFLLPSKMSVKPRSVYFGPLKKGYASDLKTVTVTNAGTAELVIDMLEMTGVNGAEFSFINNCEGLLGKGETCTIGVTGNPVGFGSKYAELRIFSNDPLKKPFSIVQLYATSKRPKIVLDKDILTFGKVLLGNTSEQKTIMLKNKGLSDLEISEISLEEMTGEFIVQNNCLDILQSGAACAMTVTFVPATTGMRKDKIIVSSNDPKRPLVYVGLQGKGKEF